MRYSSMWSVLFFIMVITLGIDSTVSIWCIIGSVHFRFVSTQYLEPANNHSHAMIQFGGLESVITGLCDEYPRVLRAHRGVFIGLLIILIYICSLPTTTYVSSNLLMQVLCKIVAIKLTLLIIR